MSNDSRNRAQRRRDQREQREHIPTFWEKPLNRIVVLALAAGFLGVVIYAALPKGTDKGTARSKVTSPPPAAPQPVSTEPSPATPPANPNQKLETTDVTVGKGDEVAVGDKVTVHYTGTLADGTKFDSSRDKGTPMTFTVGSGMIAGFSQGVVGMKVGGRRKVVIPPNLGYGPGGNPPKIPGNAVLNFDIEVLKVEKAGGAGAADKAAPAAGKPAPAAGKPPGKK